MTYLWQMQQHIVVPKWTMIFNSYRRISVTLIFRIFVVFVNSCIFCTSFTAQASNIDSLENVLASFKGSNLEKGNLLIDLSNIYWRSGDTVKMKASILDAINLAQKEGLEHVEKRAYTSLGNYYSTAQDYYLAHFYYKKAEKLCIMLNDTEYLCTIYFSLLRSFMFIEDHLNMLFYADKLLETISEWYDIETLIPIDSTKINLNDRMQRYIVTAQYYKGVATLSNEIPQDRLDFFIGLFQKTNIPNEGLLEMRIVSAIECGNIYAQINQPRKALQYLHFAREHSEFYLMPGSVKYLSTANALIAEAYAKLNQMDSAIYYINQLGETQLFFDHFAYSLHYRARIAIEAAKGDYHYAFQIYNEFHNFTDSLNKTMKSNEIARMKNWYELEQLDYKNEILHQERQKQQQLVLLLCVGLLLILLLFAIAFLFYKKTTKTNSELNKMHAIKDKLFSIISQDLRSPINSLSEKLKLANNQAIDADNKTKILQNVTFGVDNAYELIENLLLWSKNQMKEIIPVPEKFDIKSQLRVIEDDLSHFALEKKIVLENNTPNLTINTDKEMFKLILRNLITNAIKYSNPNSKVVINSNFVNKELIISVKDTGIGIRDEVKNKLFILSETRAELGTNNETGTGLGLVLCADFVKKLGGKIWVESKVGEGSTFYISIPESLKD